jgi:isoleucyl-tRNA synthetase
MRGNFVERKGGWDCHGLPVEIAVEQELGLQSKTEIEEYGIAEFNARCRESVFAHVEAWNKLTERIGFWVDLDTAYRTLDATYVDSVWWALRRLFDKGLLYEGHKVVPYCPRCGTALSSHEVAQGYEDVEDPSVYVRLPVRDRAGARTLADTPLQPGDELVVWTTTPWTLPSHAAVAIDPELTYVRARTAAGSFVVAEALVERVLGEGAEVLGSFAGREIEAVAYEAPFAFIPGEAFGPHGHTVLAADFVSADEGTGLVHTALAFGDDDYRLGESYGMTVVNPVRLDGTFDERIGAYAGRFVKDADEDLIADLSARGRVLRATRYEHSYPHCWRCGTPLLYYAKPSWYIATSRLRDRLQAANETVNWYPPHIKHGRFGDWLAGNVDWALSRERYWGTPLPIWRCASGHVHCIGSLAELHERSGTLVPDPHRPFVDEVAFPCADCGEPMRRVPEVIDVWFDSGSMPFAQHHAPLENEQAFRDSFPADYVCEALDQTRGWFYSLLAISALLFDQAPYRNVVCLGLILDGEGQKMSKSKGNAIEPTEVLDRFGADALRWYFFTSKQPWDGYRFSEETVAEGVRLFLTQVWNVYHFHVLYARAAGDALATATPGAPTDLDAWALSRLASTALTVGERLEDFDVTNAGRAISAWIDELSNWYVRRSRRRFWDGDPTAFATLRECLLVTAKLLAPLCPFLADELYENLDGREPSVHLCDFPSTSDLPPVDAELEEAMTMVRTTVALGLRLRAQYKLKIRQPLHEARVVANGAERAALERLGDLVRDELNVKSITFVDAAEELGRARVKPNYRALGKRFAARMPAAADAIAALDPDRVAATIRAGGEIGIAVDGHEHTLSAEDLLITTEALEGYGVEREGTHAVALELAIDEDLIEEGQAREIVRAVQNARRDAGLNVEDRIHLELSGDPELLAAAEAHRDYLMGEVLATALGLGLSAVAPASADEGQSRSSVTIDGRTLTIVLRRA